MEYKCMLEGWAGKHEDFACKYYNLKKVKARYEADLRDMKAFWKARKNLRKYLESKGVSTVDEFEEKYGCDYDSDPVLDQLFTEYETIVIRFF